MIIHSRSTTLSDEREDDHQVMINTEAAAGEAGFLGGSAAAMTVRMRILSHGRQGNPRSRRALRDLDQHSPKLIKDRRSLFMINTKLR